MKIPKGWRRARTGQILKDDLIKFLSGMVMAPNEFYLNKFIYQVPYIEVWRKPRTKIRKRRRK